MSSSSFIGKVSGLEPHRSDPSYAFFYAIRNSRVTWSPSSWSIQNFSFHQRIGLDPRRDDPSSA